MKLVTYRLQGHKNVQHKIVVELQTGITGEEFAKFKSEYHYHIFAAQEQMAIDGKPVSFDLDNLPVLNNHFPDLKKFMSGIRYVKQWNSRREEAKKLFTPRTIRMLDASGFVTKLKTK